jgi:hypothetical protein
MPLLLRCYFTPINPASRVSAISNKLLKHSDAKDVRLSAAWSEIFGIPTDNGRADEDAITTALLALRDEIELVQVRLSGKGCPEDLYTRHFSRVRSLASPTILGNEWRSHKAGLPGEVKFDLTPEFRPRSE